MISFFVYGRPRSKGSLRAMTSRTTGRVIMIESGNKNLSAWMKAVKATAVEQWPHGPSREAISLEVRFDFQFPKKKRVHHVVRPDLDKLLRAVLDSLTGIIYADDSQVTQCRISKGYALCSGVTISVREEVE